MRYALVILLILHGIAHLVGFATPWGLVTPKPGEAATNTAAIFGGRRLLGATASRATSFLWLAGTLSFFVVAGAVWLRADWAPLALFVVSAISLVLTAVWWPSARIGMFVNIGLVVAIVGVTLPRYNRDLTAARERARSGSVVLATAAGPIEHVVVGQGEPVLVLHGTGGGWDQGLSGAAELLRYGFKLIVPSRFGYLRTPMPANASPATEADAWITLLDSLGVKRAAVMGFSAGTVPAFQLAMRHPERISKLVLVVPAAGGIIEPPPAGPPAWVMNVVLRWDAPMWLTRQASRATMWKLVGVPPSLVPTLDAEQRAQLDRTVDEIFPVSTRAEGIRYDAGNQSGREHVYPLHTIEAPALFVAAEDDLYKTMPHARAAAAMMPNATILSYPTGGHLLLGRGGDLWPRVATFLNPSR